MIKYFIIIFGFSISGNLFAQHGHDHVWPMGEFPLTDDPYFKTEEGMRLWGLYDLDFNDDVLKVVRNDARLMVIGGTASMYCSKDGNLLL